MNQVESLKGNQGSCDDSGNKLSGCGMCTKSDLVCESPEPQETPVRNQRQSTKASRRKPKAERRSTPGKA